MRLSLVSAVVLGLTCSVLGAPQHRKHPCTKNTTDIGSHQATPSGEVQNIFLGLHPTTTAMATATPPPPGEEMDEGTPTPTALSTQLDAEFLKGQPNSTPAPESTPQTDMSDDDHFKPLKPTTTPPPASSPLPEPESVKKNPSFLVQPEDSSSATFSDTCLNTHNRYRKKHGAPDLQWDKDTAAFAEQYVASQSCDADLKHSGGGEKEYGENLALGVQTAEDGINFWYSEVKDYNYEKPEFSLKTGHFTQVVWKSATKIGCAEKKCNSGIYLSCNYDKGNLNGAFKENVLPPVK